jgi:hypothetical protein
MRMIALRSTLPSVAGPKVAGRVIAGAGGGHRPPLLEDAAPRRPVLPKTYAVHKVLAVESFAHNGGRISAGAAKFLYEPLPRRVSA